MILPIICCTNSDADRAVALLDFIALTRNKMPFGHLLIACHACHTETQLLLRISAEIGFFNVEVFSVEKFEPQPPSKAQSVNLFFQRVLQHAMRNYKGPFLLIEPDTTPTCPEWLTKLEAAYTASPKLYLSSVLADPKGVKCIGRNGVFPRGAAMDIGNAFTSPQLFEIAAGESLVARTEKTRLFQVAPIITSEDVSKVRPDAVMVHGDKSHHLLNKLREEWGKRSVPNPEWATPAFTQTLSQPVEIKHGVPPPAKLDGRSKAARLLRLQAQKSLEV